MMKQLKLFFKIAAAAALVACSNEEAPQTPPAEKEPLLVTASVDGSLPTTTTRASNGAFTSDDKIKACLQHVYGETSSVVESHTQYVDFSVSGNTTSEGDYELTSTNLFWDDFSDLTHDIRDEGHGVRSYYAYCLNGRTDISLTDEPSGTLTWTVQTNQSTGDNLRNSDLLWSGTQDKVAYGHATPRAGLTLPFSHAMSKVTIIVIAQDGFEARALNNTTVTLHDMNTSADVVLPSNGLTPSGTTGDIKMFGQEATDNGKKRTYEAIIVPGTTFTVGKKLATINNADGNNYTVEITSNMLTTAPVDKQPWNTQLDESKTKSGVNYQLTVTINKQEITAVASLTDWTLVETTAVGEIQFTGDITDATAAGTAITAGGFDLYYKKYDKGQTEEANEAASFTESTGWSYSGTESKWVNESNPIYWPNGTDALYFRALAKYVSGTEIEAASLTSPYTLTQGGDDILWATTPAYEWTDEVSNTTHYQAGEPVKPRTGAVPLSFMHALSKVTVKLKTSDNEAEKVDLAEATVTISPLATTGTLELQDGTITPEATGTLTGDMPTAESSDPMEFSSLTIPQTIGDEVKLQVKLKDGTTYSLQLNTCKLTTDPYSLIGQWVSGVHYSYEVTLNKEKISFVVYVKDWDEKTGSGDATLDW